MLARIYKPAKSAMQSGKATINKWMLEFEPQAARRPEPLMGWTYTTDMDGQIRMAFPTREDAVAFCQRHGIAFEVIEPKASKKIIKAYADNFAYGRKEPWTH